MNLRRTSRIFLRLLGLIYLFAFSSLAVQISGLSGRTGICPAADMLRHVYETTGGMACYFLCPTLFWIDCSDFTLEFACWLGTALGVFLLFGVQTAPLLASAWLLYLSIVNAGGVFMRFQWDSLLLETGFLAIFLAPVRQNRKDFVPPTGVVWLLRLLCFRLMFMSGVVKVMSGDHAWTDMTAMTYHYQTQPLPNPAAYFLFHLPLWWHRWETFAVFFVELVVPFLLFGPAYARAAAGCALIFFQILIMLSGNYAYFNWLTVALALLWFDDRFINAMLPRSMKQQRAVRHSPRAAVRRRLASAPLVSFMLFLVLVHTAYDFDKASLLPLEWRMVFRSTVPFHLVGRYGLFAWMTKSRPEITVQGSNDGDRWHDYVFKYKAGPLDRQPPLVAPHQPRLDWQLWFAAQGMPENHPWFMMFARRLLQGSKSVTDLLETNPFPDVPPRYLRATVSNYTFTTVRELRLNGTWWKKNNDRIYLEPLELNDIISD